MSASKDQQELVDVVTPLAREVVDTRNQVIKNTNVVGNLVAEVRQVARAQERHRHAFINSIAAYIIFALLAVGGGYLVQKAKVERVEVEKEILRRQHAKSQTQLERARERQRSRRDTEVRAMAFYQLMTSDNAAKALKQYPEITRLPLSRVEAALFGSWMERKRTSLAYSAYAAGMRHIGKEEWRRATVEFSRSLKLVARPAHAASLHYYFGIARAKLGNYRQAAVSLEKAIGLRAERLVSSQVRFHLAGVYEALNQRERAKSSYQDYLKRHASGSYARLARRRLKALKKK